MKISHNIPFRVAASIVIIAFMITLVSPPTPSFGSSAYNPTIPSDLNLPNPGEMLNLTNVFYPLVMKGIKIFPNNPFRFDFIIDTGNTEFPEEALKKESTKLIKYFLASLTVPERDLWVNLSPYENDRIAPYAFGQTEMGRDLLAQDYILKQLTASLMYPEEDLGEKFWDRIYAMTYARYGHTDIPVNTFNKVWIVPNTAVVYESGNMAFVEAGELEVMLEGDYLALHKNMNHEKIGTPPQNQNNIKELSDLSADVIREVILPEIKREVNLGKTFANLRQIYYSVILATWFKRKLIVETRPSSVLSIRYIDQNKITGVDVKDRLIKQKIYQQYLEAFKTGVYNYIREEYDPVTQNIIPRKYFSGGTNFNLEKFVITSGTQDGTVSSAIGNMKIVETRLDILSPNQDNQNSETAQAPDSLLESIQEQFKPLAKRMEKYLDELSKRQGNIQPQRDELESIKDTHEVLDKIWDNVDKNGIVLSIEDKAKLNDVGLTALMRGIDRSIDKNAVLSLVAQKNSRLRDKARALRSDIANAEEDIYKELGIVTAEDSLKYAVFMDYSKWLKEEQAQNEKEPSLDLQRRTFLEIIGEYLQNEVFNQVQSSLDAQGPLSGLAVEFNEQTAREFLSNMLTFEAYHELIDALVLNTENTEQELDAIKDGIIAYTGLKTTLIQLNKINTYYGRSLSAASIKKLENELKQMQESEEQTRLQENLEQIKKIGKIYWQQYWKAGLLKRRYKEISVQLKQIFPEPSPLPYTVPSLSGMTAAVGLVALGALGGIFTPIVADADGGDGGGFQDGTGITPDGQLQAPPSPIELGVKLEDIKSSLDDLIEKAKQGDIFSLYDLELLVSQGDEEALRGLVDLAINFGIDVYVNLYRLANGRFIEKETIIRFEQNENIDDKTVAMVLNALNEIASKSFYEAVFTLFKLAKEDNNMEAQNMLNDMDPTPFVPEKGMIIWYGFLSLEKLVLSANEDALKSIIRFAEEGYEEAMDSLMKLDNVGVAAAGKAIREMDVSNLEKIYIEEGRESAIENLVILLEYDHSEAKSAIIRLISKGNYNVINILLNSKYISKTIEEEILRQVDISIYVEKTKENVWWALESLAMLINYGHLGALKTFVLLGSEGNFDIMDILFALAEDDIPNVKEALEAMYPVQIVKMVYSHPIKSIQTLKKPDDIEDKCTSVKKYFLILSIISFLPFLSR